VVIVFAALCTLLAMLGVAYCLGRWWLERDVGLPPVPAPAPTRIRRQNYRFSEHPDRPGFVGTGKVSRAVDGGRYGLWVYIQ